MITMKATRKPATLFLAIIAFAIATAALWVPNSALAQPTPEPSEDVRTITVNGTGIISTTPDTADVVLGIRQSDESLKTAQDDVSTRLTAVTATLTELGVADEDVQTSNYNIEPINEYDDDGNFRGIQGYRVSVGLTVTVRDLDSLGAVLDQVVNAGVNDVWGISMYVHDTTEAANQARQAAMADARARADEFARAEGLLITGVYSIKETSAPAPVAERLDTGMAAPSAADAEQSMDVPISPGSTDIRVEVTVIYTIEQGNG